MRNDKERLLDIKEAIQTIEKYSKKGSKAFRSDELVQRWIVSHLQIIGEAARHLSDEFKETHSEIQWEQIIGMRNIIVHDYFEIDAAVV